MQEMGRCKNILEVGTFIVRFFQVAQASPVILQHMSSLTAFILVCFVGTWSVFF